MSIGLTVETVELQRVLSTYARMKNKTDADVVNKAMRYWVPFAASRVIKKTPGKFKIRRELMAPSRARPNKSKGKKSKYSNTVAAAIVMKRLKDKGLRPTADFITKVENLIAARQNSAQFLRAGFIPAYRQFGLSNRSPGTQKHFKGRSEGKKAIPSAFYSVQAFAKNAREGAYAIAPEAFRDSLIEVQRKFEQFMAADLQRIARLLGMNP
jgi:hypothetical protein